MKTMLVKDTYRLHGAAGSLIVSEDAKLEDIIRKLACKLSIRGIFLIDAQGRLSGVITRAELLKWVHLQLFGGRGQHNVSAWNFFRIVDANKAKDLLTTDIKSRMVKETDNLQTVLDRMLDHNTDVLPVVDEEGMILGDIRLSEVLLEAFQIGRACERK